MIYNIKYDGINFIYLIHDIIDLLLLVLIDKDII